VRAGPGRGAALGAARGRLVAWWAGRRSGPEPSREVAAVLVALAGTRVGDRFAECGAGPRVQAALAAAAGTDAGPQHGPVTVAVAGSAAQVPAALRRLAAGGRLVAVADDAAAAADTAQRSGLRLLHVVALAEGVAWSAQRSGRPGRDDPAARGRPT